MPQPRRSRPSCRRRRRAAPSRESLCRRDPCRRDPYRRDPYRRDPSAETRAAETRAGDLRASDESTADVSAPFAQGQPCLPGDRARPFEHWYRLEGPASCELPGELGRRLMASLQAAIAVGRDIGDDVCRRPWHDLGHEVGGYLGERAEAALLPRADERPCRSRVRDGAARGGKREPAARALDATRNRPGSRCAAPIAERRPEQRERTAAGLAHDPPGRRGRPRGNGPRALRGVLAPRPVLVTRRLATSGLPPRAGPPTGGASRRKEKVDDPLRPR